MKKLQAPTSKHQRKSKRQAGKSAKTRRMTFKYPVIEERALVVNEGSDGCDVNVMDSLKGTE